MDLLDRLLEHDRWTTRQVLAICGKLPPEELHQPTYTDFADSACRMRDGNRLDELYLDVLDEPPTPKSIYGTIAHVITHDMEQGTRNHG